MFIAFEGIDGSGKTTLSSMVMAKLEEMGHGVFLTREPTERIQWTDELKKGRDPVSGLSLFFRFTEDRFTHQDEISEHLGRGETVICDRYLLSSLAYQGALIEPLFGNIEETVSWMLDVSRVISVVPDLTICLDVDPEVSMQRIRSRASLTGFEERNYLSRVRELYREIEVPGKILLDSSGSLESTLQLIMDSLEKVLRQ